MIPFLLLFALMIAMIPLSQRIMNKVFTPTAIINTVFIFWFTLGRIGFFNQFKPTYSSSCFIALNILIVDFFIIIGTLLKGRKIRKAKIKIDLSKIVSAFRYIAFAISLAIFVNLIIGLINGKFTLASIRMISYSVAYDSYEYTQIYFNRFIYYFYQYAIRGYVFFDITFGIINLYFNKEKISKISLINFALFIIIMQSRIEIMKIAIFIIIFILFSNIKLNQKQKKIFKRITLALIISALITFSIRAATKSEGLIYNTIKSFIVDFSGSGYMFSNYYTQYKEGIIISDVHVIYRYLGGLGLLLTSFLEKYGIYNDFATVNRFIGQGRNIGSSNNYNAFYTIYFGFLNSGGVLGCILFSAIIGLLIGLFYKKMLEHPNPRKAYFATFITFIMTMGTYNYAISSVSSLMIVLCMLMIPDEKRGNAYGK